MKKLYKVEDGKVICGVCAGIARYINMDPTVVRLIVVLLTVFTAFSGVLFYIIAALVMPSEDSFNTDGNQ